MALCRVMARELGALPVTLPKESAPQLLRYSGSLVAGLILTSSRAYLLKKKNRRLWKTLSKNDST
jgi:hypothetical protein